MALWHSEAGVDRTRAIQYGVLVMTLSSTPSTVTEWLSLKLEFGRSEQHWIAATHSNKRTSRSGGVALKASAAVLATKAKEGS